MGLCLLLAVAGTACAGTAEEAPPDSATFDGAQGGLRDAPADAGAPQDSSDEEGAVEPALRDGRADAGAPRDSSEEQASRPEEPTPSPSPTSPEEPAAGRRLEGRGAEHDPPSPPPLRHLRVEVVATYPHDPSAYTQGLLLDPADPSFLLESTGQYGESELRRVDLATGRPIRRVPLPPDLFGEGLARVPGDILGGGAGDRLIQLTWRAGIAKVWDAATFEPVGEHRYSGEGWGLCLDTVGGADGAARLVMSNGSPWLTFRDPRTFAETGGVTVRHQGRPLGSLNELECVDGRVWANVYGSEQLVEIDPATGAVTAVADASGLLAPEERPGTDVFNGIAYDPGGAGEEGTFLLTGKYWPKLFRVRWVER